MEKYLPYLTAIGAIAAFLFSMYQYLARLPQLNPDFDEFWR